MVKLKKEDMQGNCPVFPLMRNPNAAFSASAISALLKSDRTLELTLLSKAEDPVKSNMKYANKEVCGLSDLRGLDVSQNSLNKQQRNILSEL